jgi:hypothetical protein
MLRTKRSVMQANAQPTESVEEFALAEQGLQGAGGAQAGQIHL